MSQHCQRRYRITNWKQYNACLKARGLLTVWLDKRICRFAACKRLGRNICKRRIGYHRGCLVETQMSCIKLLGKSVMTRTFEGRVNELHIQAAILNRFTELGRPQTASEA